jgi:hypothetical protein
MAEISIVTTLRWKREEIATSERLRGAYKWRLSSEATIL